MRSTPTGERTMIAGIMKLAAEDQDSHGCAQVLADRAVFWLM